MSPLPGLAFPLSFPTAYAVGYNMPPLQGLAFDFARRASDLNAFHYLLLELVRARFTNRIFCPSDTGPLGQSPAFTLFFSARLGVVL